MGVMESLRRSQRDIKMRTAAMRAMPPNKGTVIKIKILAQCMIDPSRVETLETDKVKGQILKDLALRIDKNPMINTLTLKKGRSLNTVAVKKAAVTREGTENTVKTILAAVNTEDTNIHYIKKDKMTVSIRGLINIHTETLRTVKV